MTRLTLGILASSCILATACTTTNVAEPSDATTPGADPSSLQADMVVDGPGAPAVATSASGVGTSAPASKPAPLPYNCQAPLMVIEEVTRLLTVAGTHATTSSACVDGPGHRVTIDEILVCPAAPSGPSRPFDVTYRVSTWNEGGRQVCGGKCPPVEPEITFQRAKLVFRSDKGGHAIEPPSSLPGLPLDATPVTKAHDGDCYGKSDAFVPRALALP
ncbi:hypothetical protein [Paraliomyxa miuraensis]|uniref:hypothetical protein n=1 Tax=Paraliomyxa miuraensis TaxID=376150 RepID=UPI0022534AF8|nr:hypothetical protein [Paraliomyxa miuraensis]MCX4240634.1 hypothetical protein [Paraliomyxa miuraensis]